MSNCLKLINNIDVSNGKYIIENNYSSTSFGVYDNSNSTLDDYKFLNIPKEYPLGFYIDSCANLNNNNNIYNDISSIIIYESDITENIKIYVSRGNDLSFNNGDYFRFYDESFNLLNISQTTISTNNFLLTASADNFYFMKGVSYEFISAFDFSNTSSFGISGEFLDSPKELTNIDSSFILYIDNYSNVNNSNNIIYYYDLSKQNISGDLELLIDSSNINYYYGTIKFKIMNSFLEDVSLSIKSYPKYNSLLSDISNISLLNYEINCDYVIEKENFHQNSLNNNDSECLTQISRANIHFLTNNKVFYEFNKETHNNLIKPKLDSELLSLNNLKYGIYDGSYVIFDICENYPITISSEYISINDNYIYSKKYAYYSNIVQNLSGVNEIYKKYDYYYGAIQFTLNSNTAIINDFSFDLFILDKSNNNISVDSSNTLIYTDFCQGICGETNFKTDLNNEDFTFKLKNQATNIFEQADFSNNENIYKLNKYDSYIELLEPYIISDRFGHTNLENLNSNSLIISSAPTDITTTELISNNFNNSFVIIYNFTYFDLSNIQLTRLVNIIDDVFIEFSEPIEKLLFKNQSQFTDIIEISTNYFIESFNFFNDIEVYIKPNASDKIYLPFEITISGNQVINQNETLQINSEIVIYKTNNILSDTNIKLINFNNLNYYLTDKINYNEKNTDSNNNISIDITNSAPFKIKDITNYSVEKNKFFNDISCIFFNSNNIKNESGSEINIKGQTDTYSNNLFDTLTIYDISNNLQINNNYDNKIFLHVSNNNINDVDISFILTFKNENNIDKFEFKITANKDLSQNINAIDFSYSSGDNFTISGEFFKNDFFINKDPLIKQNNDLTLIDLSFNGNYEFKIHVKGLQDGDFIYNELMNNYLDYNINDKIFNELSKIIYINVIDNEGPDLYFANPDKTRKGTVNDFNIPYSVSFDILNSILFLNEKKASPENYKNANPNIPIVVYNDNSIYDINKDLNDINKDLNDISYIFIPFGNVKHIEDDRNFIEISDTTIKDGSAIIVYNVKDLSKNISNDISLTIFFKDIPSLTICGEAVIDWDVNTNYYDQGLFINTNHFTGISVDVSINEPSSNSFFRIFNTISYEIIFSTDFISSKLGTYEISYNINISGDDTNDIAILKRTINVVDRKKPFVRLFDFSGTNFLTFIDASNGLSPSIRNEIFNELSYNDYKIDNSNNHIIDFSLTYLSSFHDLSRIIHAFDLCDNYTGVGNNTGDFSTNIILNISNIAIDFSNSNFNVNALSYHDISYLNSDNSFIHVTQGASNILPPLVFEYQIIDSCNNSFNFSRTVNIVDITKPNIDFSFIGLNNISYINDRIVEYDTTKNDFSYQAFDYNKNQSQFLQEIEDIIFNVEITDNYITTENIQNNYNVSISSNTINHTFKNFNDFSNTIQSNQDINQDIINLFKTFDNSFELIYDFSDNQFNDASKTRIVNIINEIEPSINVIADSNIINISFGDTNVNLSSFFDLNHPRLLDTDLSFELSYNLPELRITSISNNDVSALIYQYQDGSSIITFNNDISFFNIATNSNSFDLSSAIINPPININILPTNFQGFSSITHEAGFYLSDASLINGLTVTNDFDKFYYTLGEGSFNDVSYTGSIFDICYIRHIDREDDIISFNEFQSDPSLIGEYRITYSLTNQNNNTDSKTRQLIIEDTIVPEFGSHESNVQVNINNIYSEPGIIFSDYGSRLKKLEYKIEKIENDLITTISNNTINNFANQTTGSLGDITLLNIEDTNNSSISYTITYTIYDNADKSSTISRTINVVNLNNIIIKPIIRYRFNSDTSFIGQELVKDFSSNSPNNYDISFYYLHSSKTIFYEATTTSNFTDLIEFSYNYYSSEESTSNLLFFEPIESIIPNNVNNYLIFFQIFNNETFENNIETINFNVIDTRGPKLEFKTNNEFTDIYNIRLPLLSNSAYQKLTSNINYFNKLEKNYPSFTYKKHSIQNQIIFSIPGIKVNDIVDGNTITLSNESFNTNFKDVYDISVSYEISGGVRDGSYVDASYLLTNSGSYIQSYTIKDSNNNPTDISRIINVVPFQPFIELTYNRDFSNNIYKNLYHKRFEKYYDLDALAFDFSYIKNNDISYIIVDNNFNKNNLGIQRKTYIATNIDGLTDIKFLDIHIVDIDILKKNISLSSIIQDYSLNNPNNINNVDYKRYGVYKNNTYNILTDGSSNAFRIVNDNSDINIVFNDGFLDLSFSHLNNIVNVTSNKPTYIFDNHNYYYGNVSLNVTNDFNRLSIEYLDISGTTQITKTLKDIILYNEYFETQNLMSNQSIIEQSIANIIITVSNSSEYIDNNDVKNAYYLEYNNELIEERKTLYLPLGKYKFKQKDYTNFYNPIKFSYLPDGHFFDSSFTTNIQAIDLCNIGLTSQNNVDFSFSSFNEPNYQKYKYTRGVEHFGLAGFNISETGDNSNNGCTTLIISPTTPNPLFYYCKNFPKMGGIIYVISNMVLYKNIINLNGSILTKENNDISFANYYEPSYNEISNNLVFLSQHFDISHNNSSSFNKKHHTIGLTQQNINHNIIFLKDQTSKETNKLIFKKYEDVSKNQSINSDFSYISNYKITEDNSANYLFDSSATQLKTDILKYDFFIDNSFDITQGINYSYDYDINKIFFNNNELFNYYYYFKKYNLLQEDLISTSFKYRIGEVGFINPISIKNSDVEINFYDNLFFNNNRIVLEPLFQNKINLNLQVYIDPSTLTNPYQRLEYYNSEKLKYNLSNYQNIIDPNKILFQEYFINIFSNISGEFPAIQATDEQSIIFSNGHIELNDYLLDSSYTNGFLEHIHAMDESNDLSLQDIVYLGFKDNSNNLFCGLTQQNIYYNMFIDDEYNIIFHPYRNNSSNNIYELNNRYNYESRANNIKKLKNEKKYLIEVSSNDLYNTLTPFTKDENIYSEINVLNKNKYMDPSNNLNYDADAEFKFKTRISYKIYDELDNIDTKLNNLDIRPITLNGNNPDLSNITDIYQSYPYAYDSALQETHSHSFKINLTEHIDRNFYKNPIITRETDGLTYQNIHYSKLYYVIKDISYNSDFNLYDSINNQNILYDKTKIKTLNYLQSLIYIINFKLDYFYEIKFEGKQTAFNFNPNDYKLIGFTSYQDLTRLISGDFIDTTYSLELPNVSLNQLFATVLYNSKIIVKKYNIFAEIFNVYDFNIDIIKINNNIYNINNTLKNSIDQINQIESDINNINNQITNAYNEYYFFNKPPRIYTSLNINYILDQSSDTASILLREFETLLDLIIDFNKYKQEYNQINYELILRGIISDEDMSNNDFIDLYKFYDDISGFYGALIDNMKKLNGLYLHDISNSNQVIKYITGQYWRVSDNSLNYKHEISFNNADFSISFFEDLSNSVVINIDGVNDFSDTLYSISYNIYDLSLLKYFSNEISKNNIVEISNIEISYNNYYFYISNDDFGQTNIKDFYYFKQDYYHDNNINTLNGDDDPSGIGFLKEDSYILNFNRSIYNQSIDEAYDHLTKSFNFDTINYILNGQELVINSFQSNNITIEFDVYYNSYLYPNKYLDTIVLDMFIPDLTPPTILFKTEVIDISQTSLDNNISSIAQLLINDISYIDINSDPDISIDNDISFAYKKIDETYMNYLDNNVDDSSYVNIYIDISQVANANSPDDTIYVYYTIYDNVNNMNIVKRRVNVVDLFYKPIEFYYYNTNVNEYITTNGEDKFDLVIKKGQMLTYNLIINNIRAKDSENNSFINLNNITYTLAYQLVVDQIVTLQPNTYPNAITYKATGQYNNGTITRNIRVSDEDTPPPEPGPEPEPEKKTHCCYPAVYYKPVQHNYKLGSSNSSSMRLAKFIINS